MATTLEVALREAASALSLLEASLLDSDQRRLLLASMGWALPTGASDIDLGGLNVGEVLDKLQTLVQSSDADRQDDLLMAQRVLDLGQAISRFVQAAKNAMAAFASLPSDYLAATQIDKQFITRLTGLVLARYLERRDYRVFTLLKLAGILTVVPLPDAPFQPSHRRYTFNFDMLSALIDSSRSWAKEAYGWGTANTDLAGLLLNLADALQSFGWVAGTNNLARSDEELILGRSVPEADTNPMPRAGVTVFEGIPPDTAKAGVALFGLRASSTGATDAGLGLMPSLSGSSDVSFPLFFSDVDNWQVVLFEDANSLSGGIAILVRPGQSAQLVSNFFSSGGQGQVGSGRAGLGIQVQRANGKFTLLSLFGGTTLQASQIEFNIGGQVSSGKREIFGELNLKGGQLTVGLGSADGFISSLTGGKPIQVNFDLGISYSQSRGLRITGGGGFALTLPVNLTIGPLTLSNITLRFDIGGAGVTFEASASFAAVLGPVVASAERIGLLSNLAFKEGNAGPADLSFDFKPPSGIGISVDAGPVSGGGFISFDPANSRYFGALELSVYGVAVKAFGIIETKFPDGHKGFSFLIIISAEFTPVQLGLGFTLNGVGGLAGINRSVDSAGLLNAVRKGDLENVLFPHDVVDNAPAILHDLETIFPPVSGHYIFGPMAKIGWGTPTLVDAELGLVIEFPGPVLTVLGTVHAALPTKDEAVVELNLDVGGVLDFPKKSFSLDASLHDSRVGDFPVSGDMAMRLNWGQNPNFALAIGGFNSHYTPPPGFPALKPVTVDLGESGNPSINLHGYMALTSNTAQVGAMLEARVSKGGANLYGFIGFDAIFIFSPFSFVADIEGGVKVNFHGAGFSLHFHGTISGPSPWHLDGQVCVSILWWDACVGFSVNLGGESKPTLPGLDPWVGSDVKADGTQDVPGLQLALQNPANWGGGAPAGSFAVVTLVAAPSGTQPPVDPLGTATCRQKAAPLETTITRFAGTKPSTVRTFKVTSASIGQSGQGTASVTTEANPPTVSDLFAPAQFQNMKDADKLSSPSFLALPAGVTVSSAALTLGTAAPAALTYDQFILTASGPVQVASFNPTQAHVTAVTSRSAVALGGIRNAAQAAFLVPGATPILTLANELYTVVSLLTLKVGTGFAVGVPRPTAIAALDVAAASNVLARQQLQVAPIFAKAA